MLNTRGKKISRLDGKVVIIILAMALMLPTGVSAQAAENWSVPLAITSAIGSADVAFGANSNATDDFDSGYDVPAPPPPMEGVEAYFYYPDNPEYKKKLATSIVAPADTIIWPLKVQYITGGGAGEVTIPWQSGDIDSVPGKCITLQLEDESGNKLADMRSETSYTFTADPYVLYSFQIKAAVGVDTTHSTTLPAAPPNGVGGTAYLPGKSAIRILWIALGIALVGVITWLVRRRRRLLG
jgi:hypothetical protein